MWKPKERRLVMEIRKAAFQLDLFYYLEPVTVSSNHKPPLIKHRVSDCLQKTHNVKAPLCQLVFEVKTERTTLIPPELATEQTVPTKAIPKTPPPYDFG